MQDKPANQKGKLLEDFVAGLMARMGIDIRADRRPGSGNGKRKGDISTDIGWTFECKNSKSFRFKEAADQVARESAGYQKEAIVWHPPNRSLEQSVVILNVLDFFEMLKTIKDHAGRDEILDKYQVKRHLEQIAFHAKQIIRDL